MRRKSSKGTDVKLSWDELRRMPFGCVGVELSWDELRRKPSQGAFVKLSWDELRRMPLERVVLGEGS